MEQPLNLAVSWTSLLDKSKLSKGMNSEQGSDLKDSFKKHHLSEENFQVEEYLAKFGGVSMFDSNNEDNEDVDEEKGEDSDDCEISVTGDQTEDK